MSKTFRPWAVDDIWLLPPSVQDFVPAGHAAHLVRDLVRDELDLSAILSVYTEMRGYPPYHPGMMVALLLYAYSQGVYSSRRIARACEERLDFQAVTALNQPDFRTISEFRRRHLTALAGLFVQVLALCQRAGLVGLGHVAVDGTKLRANASKHKAMSYARMVQTEAELAREVAQWLGQAEQEDAADDAAHGERRGDEMPEWMQTKQTRLARIRAARAELEAEAKAVHAAKQEGKPTPPTKPDGTPHQPRGRKPASPPGTPKPAAQRNFTDPDSRIMLGRDGFMQAYNGQVAVDARGQIIVAHRLTNCAADQDGSMSPQPIRAGCRTKCPPMPGSARKPTWLASSTAPSVAMSPPAAPAAQPAAPRAGRWSRPCAPGSGKAATEVATGCANMSSSPSSDTSSTPEAFANSSSAASKKYPTNGQSSASPITSQSSRLGHKLGATQYQNRHLMRGKLGGYRDTLLGACPGNRQVSLA